MPACSMHELVDVVDGALFSFLAPKTIGASQGRAAAPLTREINLVRSIGST